MPSTGNWPGVCSASKETWRDVSNKFAIITTGEKVKKRSETSAMCIKLAKIRQMVGSVPARWQLVTEV